MGAYLSQPITDKDSSDGEDAKFKYGTTAMQGWRTNMEVRSARHPQGIPFPPRFAISSEGRFPARALTHVPTPSLPPPPPHQDAHATVLGLDDDTAFFGVYDGHGGKEVRVARAPEPQPSSQIVRRGLGARLLSPRASSRVRPFVSRPLRRVSDPRRSFPETFRSDAGGHLHLATPSRRLQGDGVVQARGHLPGFD